MQDLEVIESAEAAATALDPADTTLSKAAAPEIVSGLRANHGSITVLQEDNRSRNGPDGGPGFMPA